MKRKIVLASCIVAVMVAGSVIGAETGSVVRADENEVLATGDVAIDENNFPDKVFRDYILSCDSDGDGVLNETELNSITYISIGRPNSDESDSDICYDLTGIEHFPCLTYLNCFNYQIERVDLTKNPLLREVRLGKNQISELILNASDSLVYLDVEDNQLTTLKLSGCHSLEQVKCNRNQITFLDLSGCEKLNKLSMAENPLEKVNLSGCQSLTYININRQLYGREYYNNLLEVNASGCTSLKSIDCKWNTKLNTLNIEGDTNLESLNCGSCDVKELKTEGLSKLTELNCYGNQLEELNLKNCSALQTLDCSYNAIPSLALSYCKDLTKLECYHNVISNLDLRYCKELTELDCSSNSLTSMRIDGLTKITSLSCSGNKLKSLDLSSLKELKKLFCSGNLITSLDLSHNTLLTEVLCKGCQLSSINVSNNPELRYLECERNNFEKLDVSKCTKLEVLFCHYNKLTELDVSNCKLWRLECYDNQLTKLVLCDNIDAVVMHNNKLKEMDLTNQPGIKENIYHSATIFKDNGSFYAYSAYRIDRYTDGYIWVFTIDKATNLIGLTLPPTPTPTVSPTPTPGNIPVPTKPATPTPTKAATPEPTKPGTPAPTATPTPTTAPGQPTPTTVPGEPTPTTVPGQPTPTPVEPTPAPSSGSIADFVERLYTVALGRPSEKAGKDFWVKEITSGNRTGADCAREFLFSQEFANRNLSIEDFVETLYQTFFGRDSEPNGKAYWVGELKNGTKSRNDVINGFIDSTEWCNICADYGVKSGAPSAKAERASKNAIDFATRLYTCCLGRDAEDGGLMYWSLALTNLEQTGCSAAKEFFKSQEFENLKLKNEEYIRRLYTTFMDREPEASEVSYWAGEIKKGTQTRNSVLAFFGQSEEFTNICKKYGIDRGTI